MKPVFVLVMLAMSVLIASQGCKKDDNPASATTDVSGNWHGTWLATGYKGAATSWNMTLNQNGSQLNGSIASQNGSPFPISGTIKGTHIALAEGYSGCNITLDADISGNTLLGTYIGGSSCFFVNAGTWQGTRP